MLEYLGKQTTYKSHFYLKKDVVCATHIYIMITQTKKFPTSIADK